MCYMDLNFFDVITCEEDFPVPASSCSESCEYTIVGLIPFTKYVLTVSARNGVSDMDSENDDRRVASINCQTAEGGE